MKDDSLSGELRASMVNALVADGLLPGGLRAVFEAVPRHLFVPRFFRLTADGLRYEPVAAGDSGWLRDVYRNTVLVTQLDGDGDRWDALREARQSGEGNPTSSSTMPSLMALMLGALDLQDGVTVLEVGTGTGYNAALLCHRLGADAVTTVDVDDELVRLAGRNLRAAGYTPTLATADGARGYSARAPFDRIIASVSIPAIPPAWLTQAATGAVVVAHLYRDLGGDALIRLVTNAEGTAVGHFLADHGNYMPVRAVPHIDALRRLVAVGDQAGETRPTRTPITGREDGGPYLMLAALLMPSVARLEFTPTGDEPQVWLFTADSWACNNVESNTVEQFGQRRLWDELENIYDRWERLGRPSRERFGMTVHPDGTDSLWLDDQRNAVNHS